MIDQNLTTLRRELEAEAGLGDRHDGPLTVEQLAASYLASVRARCSPRRREPNNTAKNVEAALRPLRELYGDSLACELGPRHVRVLQLALSRRGLAARTINDRVAWIRSMVRWGVSMEMLGPERLAALQALPAVRPTQDGTVRRPPVGAADPADVEDAMPYLRGVTGDVVAWLRLTGARAGEAAALHAAYIERVDGLLFAAPPQHKTAWRGQETAIAMGPRATEIVERRLRPGLHVFRTHSGGSYSSSTLTQAIRRGVQRALADGSIRRPWSAHQLRHLACTECSSIAGEQVAQRLLRHRHARTTRGYIHCEPGLHDYLLRYG